MKGITHMLLTLCFALYVGNTSIYVECFDDTRVTIPQAVAMCGNAPTTHCEVVTNDEQAYIEYTLAPKVR